MQYPIQNFLGVSDGIVQTDIWGMLPTLTEEKKALANCTIGTPCPINFPCCSGDILFVEEWGVGQAFDDIVLAVRADYTVVDQDFYGAPEYGNIQATPLEFKTSAATFNFSDAPTIDVKIATALSLVGTKWQVEEAGGSSYQEEFPFSPWDLALPRAFVQSEDYVHGSVRLYLYDGDASGHIEFRTSYAYRKQVGLRFCRTVNGKVKLGGVATNEPFLRASTWTEDQFSYTSPWEEWPRDNQNSPQDTAYPTWSFLPFIPLPFADIDPVLELTSLGDEGATQTSIFTYEKFFVNLNIVSAYGEFSVRVPLGWGITSMECTITADGFPATASITQPITETTLTFTQIN